MMFKSKSTCSGHHQVFTSNVVRRGVENAQDLSSPDFHPFDNCND